MGFTRYAPSVSQTIAVCGVEHNSGTTCFCLALSNYMSSKLGLSIAYVELNATREISRIASGKNRTVFTHLGIDFYPDISMKDLPDLFQLHYDYFVLDMSVLTPYSQPEFARSNYQFVCGYVSPWKSEQYGKFIEQQFTRMTHQSDIILLGNLGTKDLLQAMNRQYHVLIQAFPYLPNPFQLSSDDWSFFEKILDKSNIPRAFSR